MRGILKQPYINLSLKGNVTDTSINGLTPSNTSVTATTGLFGESNGAMEWNASSDRLAWSSSIGNIVANKINNESTVSFWLNGGSVSPYKQVFNQYSSAGGDRSFQIIILNTGGSVNCYRFGTAGVSVVDTANNVYVTSTWQFITITTIQNGADVDVKIYVNGILSASATLLVCSTTSTYEMRIGTDATNSTSISAKITDFKIYDKKLSDIEIQSLYRQKGRLVA